jgi:hypothetical protein
MRTCFLVSVLVLGTLSHAYAQSPDRVVARDAKTGKLTTVEGTLAESPAGVVVSVGGKEKARFTPTEIVRVDLGDLPGLTPDDKSLLFGLDNEKDPEKAARGYAALVGKAGEYPRVRRAMAFREVTALARAADAADEATFQSAAPAAADRLANFAGESAKSWETVPAALVAARLYEDVSQFDRAAAVLAALAATPGLPAEQRIDARLRAADASLRSANPAAGRAAVAALLADPDVPATGGLRERLSVLDLRAKAPPPGTRPDDHLVKLRASIDAATTTAARAAGYLATGDLLLAHGRPRDALWEYLNVEVVYDQDRDDVRKAQRRLVVVFDQLGDADRAKVYREKLRTVSPR